MSQPSLPRKADERMLPGSVTHRLEQLRLAGRRASGHTNQDTVGVRVGAHRVGQRSDTAAWGGSTSGTSDYAFLAYGGSTGLLSGASMDAGRLQTAHRHGAAQHRRIAGRQRPRERPVEGPPPPKSWLQPGHVKRGGRGKQTQDKIPRWLRLSTYLAPATASTLQGQTLQPGQVDLRTVFAEPATPAADRDGTLHSLVEQCIRVVADHLEQCAVDLPLLQGHLKQRLLYQATVARYQRAGDQIHHTPLSEETLTMLLDQAYEALFFAGTLITPDLLESFLSGAMLDWTVDPGEDCPPDQALGNLDDEGDSKQATAPACGPSKLSSLDGHTGQTLTATNDALAVSATAFVPDHWEETADDPVAYAYAYDDPNTSLLDAVRPPLHTVLRHLDLRGCHQLPPLRTARLLVRYVPLLETLRMGDCFTAGNTVATGSAGGGAIANPNAVACLRRLAVGLIELRALDLSASAYMTASIVRTVFGGASRAAAVSSPSSSSGATSASSDANERASGAAGPSRWPRLRLLVLSGCPAVVSSTPWPPALSQTLSERPHLRIVL
ncbi:hypothetical protein THASP1DRAFT_29642 [Thamnocephalis sphaerospora]|uniref:Uncharacterized protein n=1 Tax=Thamnocephalis sphaerospora TaxID=78915 RepID=A0A4P9XT15_9FUNG|nr:hypothetical protein THASP1DRAFT_29642 [Thamnocephalis sphaerospora]|eukprot:RKP08550.1 hypothetical protein THASP1DRAFT_29642 [Thamnocephalis sphaerospora]